MSEKSYKKKRNNSLLFLVVLVYVTQLVSLVTCEELTLTVLHTNDVHSRFLQTNKYSGSCSEQEETLGKCYGGFARLHYKVNEIRASHKNVIYLSGGDYYQGTVWYTLYKWKVVSKFVNILNHTAMAFGNHEFDDAIAGIVPFMERATFPLISCNIDASKEPRFQGKFKKSFVTEVEGRKVGIIGYTTQETPDISSPGKLVFKDVVQSIQEESERLHAEGVKILIAVGHAGYDVDQDIAKNVPLIDAVVGGHTNTFLYHGDAPDVEETMGDYPTVIVQESGRKVPVVQAYAYGKYMGYLNLTINEAGEVTGWSGNPILLDSSVPQDEALLAELKEWGKNVTYLTKQEVGKTRVFLDGTAVSCRLRECNLGSLIADAMIYATLKFADSLYWSDVTIAILNGGGIRSSIDEKSKNGEISMDDILTVLPFENTIDLIEIKGEHLRKAFEYSVDGYDPKGHHLPGKFLQVAGLKVVYDITCPNGSRVKKLSVLCKECRVPGYVELEDAKIYKVAIPSYTVHGGDGFTVIRENVIAHHLTGILDTDMIIEYIKAKSPIIQAVEGRITFENGTCSTSSAYSLLAQNSLVILSIFVISCGYLQKLYH